jgi:hypothetical protein
MMTADLPQLPADRGRHGFKFNKAWKLVNLALPDMSICFSERSAISSFAVIASSDYSRDQYRYSKAKS